MKLFVALMDRSMIVMPMGWANMECFAKHYLPRWETAEDGEGRKVKIVPRSHAHAELAALLDNGCVVERLLRECDVANSLGHWLVRLGGAPWYLEP